MRASSRPKSALTCAISEATTREAGLGCSYEADKQIPYLVKGTSHSRFFSHVLPFTRFARGDQPTWVADVA